MSNRTGRKNFRAFSARRLLLRTETVQATALLSTPAPPGTRLVEPTSPLPLAALSPVPSLPLHQRPARVGAVAAAVLGEAAGEVGEAGGRGTYRGRRRF